MLRTDHAALQWLRRTPEPIGQQGRWLEKVAEFEFQVIHRTGRKHENADALSRKPCRQCGRTESTEVAAVTETAEPTVASAETDLRDVIRNAQREDPDLRLVCSWVEEGGQVPELEDILYENASVKTYWSQWDQLYLQAGHPTTFNSW